MSTPMKTIKSPVLTEYPKMTSFSELTKQVHMLNDFILSDMKYGQDDYELESVDFQKHLLATKYWFTRISFANKKRYILTLLEDVKSAWTLSLLLKSLWNCRPKDAVLSISEKAIWSTYDQVPMDHNRTAQPAKYLGQVMTNDRKWFHSLDNESQAIVLSELLTVAGGPVMWEVLRRAQLIYSRYREEQLLNLLECIVVDEPVETKSKKESPTQQFKSNVPPPTPESEGPNRKNAQKDLEASLATWNATIKSIRDSQKLEEVEMTFHDGSKRKIWKVNRPRLEVTETVDFVQLLPAMIGKRILSYLPRSQLADYARVNKYWAYLVDELKAELTARQKLNIDIEKLQEAMLKHDTSMDVLATNTYRVAPSSMGNSLAPSTKSKGQPSMRPSEKSAGAMSFRQFLDKLNPKRKKQKPLRNLADISERLERRGAADEYLWLWCQNVLKQNNKEPCKSEEGVLRFKDMHFPCPLMKQHVDVPLNHPMCRDPSILSSAVSKWKKNISTGTMHVPKDLPTKRYHLWSRDFSSLYKVFKLASYQSPV